MRTTLRVSIQSLRIQASQPPCSIHFDKQLDGLATDLAIFHVNKRTGGEIDLGLVDFGAVGATHIDECSGLDAIGSEFIGALSISECEHGALMAAS
jgi:hypothetical protein